MSTLAMLVRAQEGLPPPPEPTGSVDIDAVRVIGVVLVSLGVIMLLALVIRPLVFRPSGPAAPADPDDHDAVEPAPFSAPTGSGSIIQFPNPAAIEAAPQPHALDEHDQRVADRFSRVVGEGDRHQRLGERRPDRTPHDLTAAALHRVGADPADPTTTRRPPATAPIVPFPVPAQTSGVDPSLRTGGAAALKESLGETRDPGATISEKREPAGASVAPVAFRNGHSEPATAPDATGTSSVGWVGMPANRGDPVVRQAAELVVRGERSGERGPASTVDLHVIDTPTLAALHQVVRELIYCANSGQLLYGFALYSDPYLFRFMDDAGLTEEEFRDAFGSIRARPREDWEHLDLLSDVERLPDGRFEATASYVDRNGAPVNGFERYRFVRAESGWQIDDITLLDPPG